MIFPVVTAHAQNVGERYRPTRTHLDPRYIYLNYTVVILYSLFLQVTIISNEQTAWRRNDNGVKPRLYGAVTLHG